MIDYKDFTLFIVYLKVHVVLCFSFQGTVLDNIDYNIEQTSVRVEKGLQQLKKAEKYQKKNRKMMVILVLFGLIMLLLIILIFKKS